MHQVRVCWIQDLCSNPDLRYLLCSISILMPPPRKPHPIIFFVFLQLQAMQDMVLLRERPSPSPAHCQPHRWLSSFVLRSGESPDAEPEAEPALQTQPQRGWKRNPLGSGICSPHSVLRFFLIFFFFGCAVERQQVPPRRGKLPLPTGN